MSYFKNTINHIQEASTKENNSIPISFLNRFSDDLSGITKSTYTIITASSGIGKSKFAVATYVINVIDFLINNPSTKIDVRIPYYSLEESKRKFYLSLICNLLMKRYNIRISVKDLKSVQKEKRLVNKKLLDQIETLDDWFKVFEQKVEVIEEIRNTYGIYKYTKQLCESLGTITEEIHIVEHKEKKVKVFNFNNPEMYVLPITDHISLIQKQKDQEDLWAAMSKHSGVHNIELRNFYGCSPVDIQQQEAAKEKQEFYKGQTIESKLEPSLDGLANNKETQRNADIVLGLFAPDRYELIKHDGYNITRLGDHYRSLKILKNRDGEANVKIGLLFDGANCLFEELPRKEEFETDFKLYNNILKKLRK